MSVQHATRSTGADVVPFPPRRKPKRTNRGRTYPPDPIRVDDVARLLEHCTPLVPGRYGYLSAMRLRALIVILYRTGVRISEALAFIESDLMPADQALLVRHGKGDKRRIVMIDDWDWTELQAWMRVRQEIPAGAIIPIVRGRHAGQPMSDTDARRQLRDLQARAGVRRRIAPHQFRHGFAVENFREGTNLLALQKQLGHAHLGITEIYCAGANRAAKPTANHHPTAQLKGRVHRWMEAHPPAPSPPPLTGEAPLPTATPSPSTAAFPAPAMSLTSTCRHGWR